MSYRIKAALSMGAALFALVATTTLAQTLTSDQAAAPASSTPDGAVAAALQLTNGVYAGDCTSTSSPADLGKLCSRFVAERGAQRAYLVGRTFSEFRTWVFVEQGAAGWFPVGTLPFDDTAPALNVPWPAG